jgi:hypothetical protein
MEVHLGETRFDDDEWVRHAIVWINGKRWEGTLREQPDADQRKR